MVFGSKAVASAALLLASSGAFASMSEYCFSIRATATINGQLQTALFQVRSDSAEVYYDEVSGTYGWDLQSPLDLVSQEGTLLGVLRQGSIRAIEDPVVSVNFAVSAGAVMTSFDITSTQLSFANINSATGSASAAFSANDDSGDGLVTVSHAGSFLNNALYVARYNNVALPLDGTDFGGGLLVSGPYSHPAVTGDAGSVPNQVIPGTISNMQAGFQFTVTPGDFVSGTSTFTVVPAPGAVGLLGLAGLIVSRRRR
jgi:hypothetical protein